MYGPYRGLRAAELQEQVSTNHLLMERLLAATRPKTTIVRITVSKTV